MTLSSMNFFLISMLLCLELLMEATTFTYTSKRIEK